MDTDKHAFGATCIAAIIYSSITFPHVQVVDDETSPTKGTIHHTTDNDKHVARMMLTALLLRHPTFKSFLIREPKQWKGSASPRLNGDVGWTGQPKQTAAPGKGPGRFGTGCFPGQCRDRQKLPPPCPPQDTQGSETKRTHSIREG